MTSTGIFQTRIALFGMAFFLLTGCATSSKLSSSVGTKGPIPPGKVAISPGGGLLGDAIGTELLGYGYDVVSTSQVHAIFGQGYWSSSTLLAPKHLEQLRKKGVGMLLTLTPSNLYGGVPQSAVIRLIDVTNGETLAAVNWQSGDYTSASSRLVESSREIAAALMRSLPE
jgi:hypothetical protein